MSEQPPREATANRFIGSLVGMIVGDALARPSIGLTPYSTHKRYQWIDHYYPVDGESGCYTSVSRIALAVARAISETRSVDAKTCADRQLDAFKMNGDIDDISKAAFIRYGSGGVELDKAGDPDSVAHEFLTRHVPVGIYAAATGVDDLDMAKLCRAATGVTHSSKRAIIGGWVVAKIIRDSIRNFKVLNNPQEWYQSDKSLFASIVTFVRRAEISIGIVGDEALADRLLFVRRRLQDNTSIQEMVGLIGNRNSMLEVLPFSVFCFMRAPDSFQAVTDVASMGGASTTCTSLVCAMQGAYGGLVAIPEDMRVDAKNSSKVVELGEKLAEVLLDGHEG